MRNSGLKAHLERAGMRMIETPVGDKYVTDKIFELRAAGPAQDKIGLGGEQAGHILIVDDGHPTGDGVRTALFVMRVFLESGAASLASFAAEVGKTPQIIASAHVGNGPRLSRSELDAMEAATLAIPGIIRVNLRYSGTEPLLRAMLESDGSVSEEVLGRIALERCRKAQSVSGLADGEVDILNVTSGGVIRI
jgi:phosphoglucosamine mutase